MGATVRTSIMIPVLMFVAGLAIIGIAVASGEGEVSLVLIFPVFSGSSGLFMLGTALIVLSFMTGFFVMVRSQIDTVQAGDYPARKGISRPAETKYGGVVMVGPVPIAFGSDKKTAFAMFVIGVILAVCCLLAILIFLFQ
ncbi:MAG: DUF131 domain-containing protein [Candidatus Thermoplasmatota archaeon]|nr:DUF131 domain-containing protein [Candidatus Thermoplasmatota archaeon]